MTNYKSYKVCQLCSGPIKKGIIAYRAIGLGFSHSGKTFHHHCWRKIKRNWLGHPVSQKRYGFLKQLFAL